MPHSDHKHFNEYNVTSATYIHSVLLFKAIVNVACHGLFFCLFCGKNDRRERELDIYYKEGKNIDLEENEEKK